MSWAQSEQVNELLGSALDSACKRHAIAWNHTSHAKLNRARSPNPAEQRRMEPLP